MFVPLERQPATTPPPRRSTPPASWAPSMSAREIAEMVRNNDPAWLIARRYDVSEPDLRAFMRTNKIRVPRCQFGDEDPAMLLDPPKSYRARLYRGRRYNQ